jgi:hypothetical protein
MTNSFLFQNFFDRLNKFQAILFGVAVGKAYSDSAVSLGIAKSEGF